MIAFILIAIAGICKAVSDTLVHHFETSIFSNRKQPFKWFYWWYSTTGDNKYKSTSNEPRFFGATTFLVWLTDGWHFFNMLQYTAFIGAIVFHDILYSWWIDAILLKCVFTITFEVFYKWVLIKK